MMDKGNTSLILTPFLDGLKEAGAQVSLFYTIETSGEKKYYFSFPKHCWFIGGFVSNYYSDDEEIKDGITYDGRTMSGGGIAGGYQGYYGPFPRYGV